MANADPDAVVAKVERGIHAQQFRDTFGADIVRDRARAFDAIVLALEVFQQDPQEFAPYNSRFDRWLRGKAVLTPEEERGFALFNDPKKGNCASCHPSQPRAGAAPQFTDYGFIALGVPRNRHIPANANSAYFDFGLCGPERKDLSDRSEYCGLFRAPTLRNVATRRTFFHNGVFHDLKQVLEFYVERDRKPRKWYGVNNDRQARFYDDLPVAYRDNVNTEAPFSRDGAPALSKSEMAAVIAFLGTLTDADAKNVPRAAERFR
jgi:cytochrome c peroxidase